MGLLSGALVQGSELKLLAPMGIASMLWLRWRKFDSDNAMVGTLLVKVHRPT